MALTKIKLGKYIELFSQKCNIPNLTNDQVSGVNKEKEFFEPSTQVGGDTSKYKIVPPNYFACNLMHVGRDVVLPIAYNHSGKNKIVSPAYFVFKFIENDELLSDYFFIFLKSAERDRYFWFHTDGSVRDGMSWEDFIDVEIELPPMDIQRKYVEIYNGMVDNQLSYQAGLEDLFLTCQGFIERAKKIYPSDIIGNYISFFEEKNKDNDITLEQGINIKKEFITPQRSNSDLSNRKIVRSGQFAFCTQLNNENVAIAFRRDEDCVVSSVYNVFEITKKELLLNEYLMLWLIRPEFGRFVYWASVGSAYEFLSNESIINYQIPIPPIEVQQNVADIYNAYLMRREINEQLKQQIKIICPVLIKGAVEEAKLS